MVLNFPISIIFQLTNLINKILYTGHFPQAWKTATVIPILKPGKDPTLATSHRPISLLPVLSKLAERIILNRLNDHLQKNDIPHSPTARFPCQSFHIAPTSACG
ncbi:RNA-directed DNA polymerase from mobile element jockey [Trichonephila clavipes]|nr:RNA-directed DNA polymerase from mobile element jockey [Trichonephila clavipes]